MLGSLQNFKRKQYYKYFYKLLPLINLFNSIEYLLKIIVPIYFSFFQKIYIKNVINLSEPV